MLLSYNTRMGERRDDHRFTEKLSPQWTNALRGLCQPFALFETDRDPSLRYKTGCDPRTFDIHIGVESEESTLRQISHDTGIDIGVLFDIGAQSSKGWEKIIRDMTDEIDIYKAATHMGLVSSQVLGVNLRRQVNGRMDRVAIVRFDITSLGAKTLGFVDGVVHSFPDCDSQ